MVFPEHISESWRAIVDCGPAVLPAVAVGLWLACQPAFSQEADGAGQAASGGAATRPAEPLALKTGPHLFVDDYWIARGDGISRKVCKPGRHLARPVVTGAREHQNWQPFLTVLHDPAAPARKQFRMWYNVDTVDDPGDGEYFGATGCLESADGTHWPGPYERLNSLTADGRVRFGASVLDDGPTHRPPAERFKMLYFDAGKQVGPRVAFSPDGLRWAVHQGGKPILKVANGDDIWTAFYDPLRKRYFLIGKLYGPYTWTNLEGKKVTASIRRYFTSVSRDFKSWGKTSMVFSPDRKDPGVTQWYGAAGFQTRGDLILGFLRVLRDDATPRGAPSAALKANATGSAGLGAAGLGKRGGSGMGYTVLAWTRDGQTWHRDRHTDPFLEPDPKVGAWDHAMAWVGSAAAVGEEVYLYYAGYRWGHKYHHSIDRQIGLVKIRRDRYVARSAGRAGGTLTTPLVRLKGDKLTLNVDAARGLVRVQVRDAKGTPIPGLTFDDCHPITADSLDAPVRWKSASLSKLGRRPVSLQFRVKNASLYALGVGEPSHHAAAGKAGPGPWSRPAPLSGGGAIGSPGGTHPLAMSGRDVHAVWEAGGNVHYRRSSDAGASWSKGARLTSSPTAVYPVSLELSGQVLHLIWPDRRHGGLWEVYHKRSTDGGKTWGPERRLTEGVDLFRMGTAVSGENVHVVWGSRALLEKVPAGKSTWTWTWGEIYYKRSTDGGVTWDKTVRLTRPKATAMRPGVAASGKYVHVTWFDRRDSKQKPAWDWEIYTKRSTDGGATWGPDVRMSDTRAHSRHPQILATGGGRVCCIWEDGQRWLGGAKWAGDGAMYASVSTDNGRTWKAPRRITFVNRPNGRATHAKSFASGPTLHLTWTDALPGSATHPIGARASYYACSRDGGLTWGPAEPLAAGMHGQWGDAVACGSEAGTVVLLSRGGVHYVTMRPIASK